MSQTSLVSNIYNPANQTEKELLESFIVRINEFERIFSEIKKTDMKYPEQHFIIQGPRGSGKTTLLIKLSVEIKNDKELNKWLIPIRFNEEQYNIRTLYKLWEEIALRLDECEGFYGLYDKMRKYWDEEDYEIKCYEVLSKSLQSKKKKIILMIDNFGDMLKKFQEREHQRLREVLITSDDIRIIGASSVVMEFTYDYSKPFFEFFNIIQLEGLNHEDTISLLLKLSEMYKQKEVEKIVSNNPGRIEVLRRLTGGVPRTIILLFEIFADNSSGSSFKDLESILDRVTPLYKHRMDDLSSQQQEIIDAIAMNWDALSTREIAQKTRMDSKTISSYLNLLEKNKIVAKITTDTKNHLYQIDERFFNIWYLMRYGNERDKNRVLWLTQFMECWCDKEELVSRTKMHIDALEDGQLYGKYALYMTEALAKTRISVDLQDHLIKTTRKFIGRNDKELLEKLSKSDKELFKEASSDYNNKNYESSLKKFLSIVNKNTKVYFYIANIYGLAYKDYNKVEEYYLKAVKGENVRAMFNLACMYEDEGRYEKAEEYYLMAVDHGNSKAMNNLANIYKKQNRLIEAEKYYLMAIEQNDYMAMRNLGDLYKDEYKDYDKAEKYYLMAVEQDYTVAMNKLAWLYYKQKKNKEKAFKLAEKSYNIKKDKYSSQTFSMILLWNNRVDDINHVSKEFIDDEKSYEEFNENIMLFFMLMIAKKQFNLALKIFKENKYNLVDKYKPVYYALMHFMQDEYPNEYKKMGKELKETVKEIIAEINEMAIEYA